MFRTALFAVIAIASLCQSANAQLNVVDSLYDYKIEIRERSQAGLVVFYDTHAPISNALHQINRVWRAFQSPEEASVFFAENPEYEILEQHSCRVDESEWKEVDTVGTYAEARAREDELYQKNGFPIETRMVLVYNPAMQSAQLNQWGFRL